MTNSQTKESKKDDGSLTLKDLSNYGSTLMGVPFHIANGDSTVWQKTENGLVIYFHSENFWCNPPTDTNMECNAIKAINKHGITYLPEDYVDNYNKNQRHKDLEQAMKRHRQYLWDNRHLYPWLKKTDQL
jgi:hypothetical protein